MPDYAVMTAFNGRDNVSHLFRQMGRSASGYRNDLRGVGRDADHASTALRNATKHGYNFGAIVKGILVANALRGGFGMITGGLQKVGSDYLQFGDVMTGAVARFDEVDVKSAAFGETIDKMGKSVRNAVAGTRHSAVSGAQALNELAKAGYNSNAALGILPNLAAFATAAQEDLAGATTMSSDILGAFGLRDKDVQVQLRNHIRLNDELTKSALLATGDMRDLFETLKDAAPISKEFGVTQETVLALSVALSNAGIKGSEAATAMKRAMTNLYASSMQEELKLNGIFAFDNLHNPRKFTAVLGDLSKALDKLTPEQRIPIIKRIFGMYGLAGSIKMMRELKAVAEYEDKINKSGGLTKTMADAANSSPFAKLVMLGNTALEKGFQVLDAYSGKAKGGFEWLTEKIKNFDVRPLITALDTTGRAAWTLYKIAEPFIPMMPYLIGGFVGWKVALAGLELGSKVILLAKFVKLGWSIGAAMVSGLGPIGALTTAVQFLGSAIATAMAPLIAAAPVLSTVLAILAAAGYTAHAARENWGDARTADQLVAESQRSDGPQRQWAAPNANEASSRAAVSKFMGTLNIANAPAGSSVSTQMFGPGSFDAQLLGANP